MIAVEWCIGGAHHGHVSIDRDVFSYINYKEDEYFKIGEDSVFIRDIINKYGRNKNTVINIDLPLSQYVESINQ